PVPLVPSQPAIEHSEGVLAAWMFAEQTGPHSGPSAATTSLSRSVRAPSKRHEGPKTRTPTSNTGARMVPVSVQPAVHARCGRFTGHTAPLLMGADCRRPPVPGPIAV